MLLLLVKSAIRNAVENKNVPIKWNIQIDFLPYARQDRVCAFGQADSLDVFLSVISESHLNEKEFVGINVKDVHSEKNTIILSNKYKIDFTNNLDYDKISKYLKPDYIVSPDSGAYNRSRYAKSELNVSNDIISFVKHRNPSTGHIESIKPKFDLPENLNGKECLIVDDICDGGGTFLPIAKQLKEKGAIVYLYVTHGIFSKGLHQFTDFDKIFTTSSVIHEDPLSGFDKKVIIV